MLSLFTKTVVPPATTPSYSWEDYVYRDGQLLGAWMSNGSVRHFDLDHLGSVRLETDGAGAVAATHDFWPYGEETAALTGSERMKYTGHERDLGVLGSAADDMDYMHARYYRPLVGRFLSMDPLSTTSGGPQGWNRYAYVLGRPLSLVDPSGQFGEVAIAGLVAQNALVWANAFTFYDTITVDSAEQSDNSLTGLTGLADLIRGNSLFQAVADIGALESRDFGWERTLDVSGMGLAAFADGVIPFGDPFESNGFYNPDELGLEYSRKIGEATRDLEIAIATAGTTAETRAGAEGGNWVTKNLFRWGVDKQGGHGLHFHLGPGTKLMRHHLPKQFYQYYHCCPRTPQAVSGGGLAGGFVAIRVRFPG